MIHNARIARLAGFMSSVETVNRSLRQVLADSQVAALSIAVLLLWSLDATFQGLWDPAYRVAAFLVTSIAIWGVPYHSLQLTAAERFSLLSTFYFLYSAIGSLSAAWLLSQWVYGVDPFRSLAICGSKLTGGKCA
jgi:hypothetical protein